MIKDLPPKIRSVIDIPTDDKICKKIQACLNGAMKSPGQGSLDNFLERASNLLIEDGDKKGDDEMIFIQLFGLTSEAKLKGVLESMDDLLLNEKKFIIFAHHRTMMKALEEVHILLALSE